MKLLSRRRFLTIAAASALAGPAMPAPTLWSGVGMGGALSVRLDGVPPSHSRRLLAHIGAEVSRIEALFSLYRDSALTRLNRDGRLAYPTQDFLELCALADRVHHATQERFDPTVQALWVARAQGGDTGAARDLVGWSRVEISSHEIRLRPGMGLTFNGIAQGFAADRIAAMLRAEGLNNVLIDMGEIASLGPRADGKPWYAQVQRPDGLALADILLENRALATSSPMGTLLPDRTGHILDPRGGDPLWSTVAVSAPSAAVADALSTGFCLMGRAEIDEALLHFGDARCEVLAKGYP